MEAEAQPSQQVRPRARTRGPLGETGGSQFEGVPFKVLSLASEVEPSLNQFGLNSLKVKLKDSATALLFSGGWLFVGLWDGQVQAFAQSGEELLLTGHRKRARALGGSPVAVIVSAWV